jgi:hypothetical protein
MIANIGSLIAVSVGVFNLVTFREIWILAASMGVLVGLSIYAVMEKRKLQKKQKERQP